MGGRNHAVPLSRLGGDLVELGDRHELGWDRVERHFEGHAQNGVEASISLDASPAAAATKAAVCHMQHMSKIWGRHFTLALPSAPDDAEPDTMSERQGGERPKINRPRIRFMDEPTAALGPQETAQVGELIKQLKKEGIGIFLISHDIHDVFDLADRVSVMKNGQLVGHARTEDVTKDEVLGMIILGKVPPKAIPGPGAMPTTNIRRRPSMSPARAPRRRKPPKVSV